METRKLKGANCDIDLTSGGNVDWKQDECPWNKDEGILSHKCAVKNTSICEYFRGLEYLDTVLCCYPHANPGRE
jgi:hypothetical protein